MRRDICTWTRDNEGNYETECGEMACFFEGGPIENSYGYCPYCSGTIKVAGCEQCDGDHHDECSECKKRLCEDCHQEACSREDEHWGMCRACVAESEAAE